MHMWLNFVPDPTRQLSVRASFQNNEGTPEPNRGATRTRARPKTRIPRSETLN